MEIKKKGALDLLNVWISLDPIAQSEEAGEERGGGGVKQGEREKKLGLLR